MFPSVHEEFEESFEETVVVTREFENVCIEGAPEVIDASHKGDAVAEIDIDDEDLRDSSEYGYGFWLRFMSRYPEPLYDGLK